ncbi:CopG family transcriptional regulator [Methylocella silvestris]|uniref:ribbon-helix-helix protein, CopG family n=1 Tax=Methylocella silvestris TaxID=199596 RepID=UPI0009FDF845
MAEAIQPHRRSPNGTHLPTLAIRCPPDLKTALKRRARDLGTTPSVIVRAALANHLGAEPISPSSHRS